MMKVRSLTLVFAAIMILFAMAAAAGERETGGGHGVVSSDGDLEFLDALVTSSSGQPEPVTLLATPLTAGAAETVLKKIAVVSERFPVFAAALKARFLGMKWAFSRYALAGVADAQLAEPYRQYALLQMMRQEQEGMNGECRVLIDRKLMEGVNVATRERMLIHELLLCKLGLNTPRDVVRRAGKALHDADLEQLRLVLDALSPAILSGRFELRIRFASARREVGKSAGYEADGGRSQELLNTWDDRAEGQVFLPEGKYEIRYALFNIGLDPARTRVDVEVNGVGWFAEVCETAKNTLSKARIPVVFQ